MGLLVDRDGANNSLKKWIQVLASGVNKARETFYDFVSTKKLELKFNAQSIYMSEYLNQLFDPSLKRIYIVNDATLFDVYIYRNSETITALDIAYVFRNSETITDDEQIYLDTAAIDSDKDFQVLVPSALSSLVSDGYFLASVNKYKLPDKTFEVLTY